MRRVITFGVFDFLHPGHLWLLQEARALGNYLTVIVARDEVVKALKGKAPSQQENVRLEAVQAVPQVDQVLLGDVNPESYKILEELPFDVLAVGYDQPPTDKEMHKILLQVGKESADIVRIQPFQEDVYKTSLLRS